MNTLRKSISAITAPETHNAMLVVAALLDALDARITEIQDTDDE